uniref:Uncharacterized protein n=1 Tax=Eutreptiella gymnastica TaxID=73025 RepID=A0A7S4LDY9_9EUGL
MRMYILRMQMLRPDFSFCIVCGLILVMVERRMNDDKMMGTIPNHSNCPGAACRKSHQSQWIQLFFPSRPETVWYLRQPQTGFKAVQFNDPTNDCGGRSDM